MRLLQELKEVQGKAKLSTPNERQAKASSSEILLRKNKRTSEELNKYPRDIHTGILCNMYQHLGVEGLGR